MDLFGSMYALAYTSVDPRAFYRRLFHNDHDRDCELVRFREGGHRRTIVPTLRTATRPNYFHSYPVTLLLMILACDGTNTAHGFNIMPFVHSTVSLHIRGDRNDDINQRIKTRTTTCSPKMRPPLFHTHTTLGETTTNRLRRINMTLNGNTYYKDKFGKSRCSNSDTTATHIINTSYNRHDNDNNTNNNVNSIDIAIDTDHWDDTWKKAIERMTQDDNTYKDKIIGMRRSLDSDLDSSTYNNDHISYYRHDNDNNNNIDIETHHWDVKWKKAIDIANNVAANNNEIHTNVEFDPTATTTSMNAVVLENQVQNIQLQVTVPEQEYHHMFTVDNLDIESLQGTEDAKYLVGSLLLVSLGRALLLTTIIHISYEHLSFNMLL